MTEILLVAVGAPVVVGLAAWILKTLYDIKGITARDEERWKQNWADHDRAFKAIDELKEGQQEILRQLGDIKNADLA